MWIGEKHGHVRDCTWQVTTEEIIYRNPPGFSQGSARALDKLKSLGVWQPLQGKQTGKGCGGRKCTKATAVKLHVVACHARVICNHKENMTITFLFVCLSSKYRWQNIHTVFCNQMFSYDKFPLLIVQTLKSLYVHISRKHALLTHP